MVAGCRLHPLAEHLAIGSDFGFIPRPARWTDEVSIRGRDDIAQITGTQALYQAKLAENCWSPVKLPGFATVVRTDADV